MKGPTTVYGSGDVADALGMSAQQLSNCLRTYVDTPPANYVTPSGRQFWNAVGMKRWRAWDDARTKRPGKPEGAQ